MLIDGTKIREERPASVLWFFLFAVIFAGQVLPRLTQDSPAGDECMDVTDGCDYWSGDIGFSFPQHLPLARCLQGIPFRLMGLKVDHDVILPPQAGPGSSTRLKRFETALAISRLITMLFGLGIGFTLYWVCRWEQLVFVIVTLFLWSTEPALLAFSGLAGTDVPLTMMFFLSVLMFKRSLEKPKEMEFILSGLLMGLALTIKFSALLLIPVFIALEIIWRLEPKNASPDYLADLFKRWALGVIIVLIWIFSIYLPGTICDAEHHWPFYYYLCLCTK